MILGIGKAVCDCSEFIEVESGEKSGCERGIRIEIRGADVSMRLR